jgi:hypothetical protein
MRKGTSKSPYPRTLLADVLCLLMGGLGLNPNQLAGMIDESRATVCHVLHATRPCKNDLLGRLCVALLPGRNAQLLINAFLGDCAGVLRIPEMVVQLEPTLAPRRATAMQTGLDIGALCCSYDSKAIGDDMTNMEQLGRWLIACRWAGYAVAVAQQAGDTCGEMKARLRHARLLLASSRFAECQEALNGLLTHLAKPRDPMAAVCPVESKREGVLLCAQGDIYAGWLDYERGRYRQAVVRLDNAAGILLALAGPQAEFGGKTAIGVAALAALADQREVAELLDLALHLRAKVLAEQAIYTKYCKDAPSLAVAGRALAESIAVSTYFNRDGPLGHGLLWMARLIVTAATERGDGLAGSLLTRQTRDIVIAAQHRSAPAVLRLLESPSARAAKRMLSLVGYSPFNFAFGSPLQRGYFRRAKGSIEALQASSPEDFQKAYFILADAAQALSTPPLKGQPDLRGLGPLYFEVYRVYEWDRDRLWQKNCWDKSKARPPCALDWLVASAAAHPTPFAIAALAKARAQTAAWDRDVASSRALVLSMREPFHTLGRAAAALWADEAQQRLEQNVDSALRAAAAGDFNRG